MKRYNLHSCYNCNDAILEERCTVVFELRTEINLHSCYNCNDVILEELMQSYSQTELRPTSICVTTVMMKFSKNDAKLFSNWIASICVTTVTMQFSKNDAMWMQRSSRKIYEIIYDQWDSLLHAVYMGSNQWKYVLHVFNGHQRYNKKHNIM